jgi:DNA-binding response OmpR family regulator
MREGFAVTPAPVLLVEDEFLIALDISDQIEALGYRCHTESTVDGAMAFLEHTTPRFAVLDHQLWNQVTNAIADRLVALGVPFCVCSGAQSSDLDGVFSSIPFLSKPFSSRSIVEVVEMLQRPGVTANAAG